MLGFTLSLILVFFIFVYMITVSVMSATGGKKVTIASNSILHISFNEPISERTDNNPFSQIDFSSFRRNRQPGLNEIIELIGDARDDGRISGIFLDVSSLSSGLAAAEEIRNALIDFRTSGKFVYAYADDYSQGAYYLASAAEKIWLNPVGMVGFDGFETTIPFIRSLLEKLEVEPQIIRHGKFKSAVEPLILDRMSEEPEELPMPEHTNIRGSEYYE